MFEYREVRILHTHIHIHIYTNTVKFCSSWMIPNITSDHSGAVEWHLIHSAFDQRQKFYQRDKFIVWKSTVFGMWIQVSVSIPENLRFLDLIQGFSSKKIPTRTLPMTLSWDGLRVLWLSQRWLQTVWLITKIDAQQPNTTVDSYVWLFCYYIHTDMQTSQSSATCITTN
jgi:hypothetical protein